MGFIHNMMLSKKLNPIRRIHELTRNGVTHQLGVYFNQAPVFRVALTNGGGGGRFEPPAAGPHGAGRGSLTDPDIVPPTGH